jgi:hypothetical protein
VPPIIQRWQENNYTWGAPRSWACFRPDADVLVPMYYNFDQEEIVSPFAGERSIRLLMRLVFLHRSLTIFALWQHCWRSSVSVCHELTR